MKKPAAADLLKIAPKPLDRPLVMTTEAVTAAPKYKSHPAFLRLLDGLATEELPSHTARADRLGIAVLSGAWTVGEGESRTSAAGWRLIGVIKTDGTPSDGKRAAPFASLAEAVEYFESRLGKNKKEKKDNEDLG